MTLASACGVNPAWLAGETGEMLTVRPTGGMTVDDPILSRVLKLAADFSQEDKLTLLDTAHELSRDKTAPVAKKKGGGQS